MTTGVTFDVDRATVIRPGTYGLDTRELTLVLYLHAAAGRPLTEADRRFIAAERDWTRLAWYYGLPPVVFADGLLILRRPAPDASPPRPPEIPGTA